MEYIEGHDLEQRLTHHDDATGRLVRGQPYPQADVLRWGMALCRVLEYLADRQPHAVVHHDIKPANLLLDSSSGEVRLVDFGTAKARLLAAVGSVGLQKSSIHGTQGYAAPEQYRGESEPRSDIYALAATLYHLATDDDPRSHPFDFPQINRLGAFGQVLRAALNPDVAQRSSAAAVYRQLESLLVLSSGRPLEAPDGAELTDISALATWCEQHWHQATTWLYGKLPDQVELWWGQTRLAHDLRAIVQGEKNEPSAGLDAALALLDPHGFGRTPSRLTSTTQTLTYSNMTPNTFDTRPLTIENVGRRHARAAINLPPWLTSAPLAKISLPPGGQTTLHMTAYGGRLTVGGRVRDKIAVKDGQIKLLEVEAQTFISRWWRLLMIGRGMLRHLPRTIAIVGALFALTMCCGGGQGLKGLFQNSLNSQKYEAGVAAMDRGGWAEASQQFGQITGSYRDTTQRRQEINYQLGIAALQRDAWGEARAALQAAGKYGDAATLLHTSYEDERQRSGLLLQSSTVPAQQVSNVVFVQNGQKYISIHNKTTIKLWRTNDNTLLQAFAGHSAGVTAVALGPDGQTIASAGANGVIKIWRVRDGARLALLDAHTAAVFGLLFSPDGQTLASQGEDDIKLWDTHNNTLIHRISISYGVVRITFTPDNEALVAVGSQRNIRVWRVSDDQTLASYQVKNNSFQSLTLSPDGTMLASNSPEETSIKLYSTKDGALLHDLTPLTDATGIVAFSPDGQILATGNEKNQVILLWSTRDGALLGKLPVYQGPITSVAFAPDGRTLFSTNAGGAMMVWRTP